MYFVLVVYLLFGVVAAFNVEKPYLIGIYGLVSLIPSRILRLLDIEGSLYKGFSLALIPVFVFAFNKYVVKRKR